MDNHQLINQDSENTEWWTPPAIIEVARVLMGSITFDPACSVEAYQWQKEHCEHFLDANGLESHWWGNVWMNHPFGKDNAKWIQKLIDSHDSVEAHQACCITFASTSEKWFAPLLNYPQFFFIGRINYIDSKTQQPLKGVTKGSVFTYLFDDEETYYEEAKMQLQEAMNEAGFRGVAK